MPNNLHFPSLSRLDEESYYCQTGDFYAASNYQSNYDMIARDCKYRCVYCDATEKECGGERFSLDHFRPRDVFASKFNGILLKHPYNLHLSCQKCNVLKSKDWQGCEVLINGPTYLGGKGYIDRFEQELSTFMNVDIDGRIRVQLQPENDNDPAEYMIQRLHLNRPNRVYLRKKRHVNKLVNDIESLFSTCTKEILEHCENNRIGPTEGITIIGQVEKLRDEFLAIR